MANVDENNDSFIEENHIVKKPKLDDDETEQKKRDVHSYIKDLSSFKVDKILNNNTRNKLVCLQGTFANLGGPGLVILEKSAFEENVLKSDDGEYFTNGKNYLKKQFQNDIYGNYEFYPVAELNCKFQ